MGGLTQWRRGARGGGGGGGGSLKSRSPVKYELPERGSV